MSEPSATVSEAAADPVRPGPVFRVLLTFIVGMIPGFVLADVWVGWKTSGQSDDTGSDYYLMDQRLGWVPRPHFENPEFGTRLDRFGMRSPEIPADAPPDEVRVLGCGASRLYGAGGVQHSSVWNFRLQEALDAEAPGRVRVLNGAVMAYSVVQSCRRARDLIEAVEPDIVFIAAAPSAQMLLDPSSARGFVYVGDELVEREVVEPWPEFLRPAVVAAHQLLLHSNIYTRFRAQDRLENEDRPEVVQWWNLTGREEPESIREPLERTWSELERLRDFARERGVALRLMVMPDYYQDGDARWEQHIAGLQAAGAPPIGTPRLLGVELMLAKARELGIEAWDFTSELNEVGRDNPRYLIDAGHWTADGHALIARGLYERLTASGLLAEAAERRAANPRTSGE